MWTLRSLSAHQAQISVHHRINPSPCNLSCSQLRCHRRLVHACASRLKQLSPAAVEDTSADDIALEVFECIHYTEYPPEFLISYSQLPEDAQIAAKDSGNSLQQRPAGPAGPAASNIPPHLQPLSNDWTESNDEDITNAVQQLVRPLPKPAAAENSRNPYSSSSSSSVLLLEQLQTKSEKELIQAIQDGEEHHHENNPADAQAPPTKAAAAAAVAIEQAEDDAQELPCPGSFFASRATLLVQLQQQQRQMQRQVLLQKQRKNLYTYALSASGEVTKVRRPGLKSPLQQTQFKLAKVGAQANDDSSISSSSSSTSIGDNGEPDVDSADSLMINARKDSTVSVSNAADSQIQQQQQQQQQQQLQLQQQWSELADEEDLPAELQQTPIRYLSSSSSSSSSSSTGGTGSTGHTGSSSSTGGASSTAYDPSRGLCLSAFLYCCSRSSLLTLTWQLGLPPGALKFVSKVSDADLVLHVKPKRGERHYQYDDFRQQAAAKGIPFVDLKNLSLQELQLYLLPVYRLYAGEVSPRDLLKRKRRRGWKRRYTNIKLPPA